MKYVEFGNRKVRGEDLEPISIPHVPVLGLLRRDARAAGAAVSPPIPWVYDDGGRVTAGFRGHTGDCVVRAIAIATGRSYVEVYDELNRACTELAESGRRARVVRSAQKWSSRKGLGRPVYEPRLLARGWRWVPTMSIGSGCTVHLAQGELPGGTLIVSLSRHIATVIDGVLHDTGDCTRGGTRCVYGYFTRFER